MILLKSGFSTSLCVETLDQWRDGFGRAFAQPQSDCRLAQGDYPLASHALTWLLGLKVRVPADMTVRLERHTESGAQAKRDAPMFSLTFPKPVRIVKDVLPSLANYRLTGWVCGEYNVAIHRVSLDGHGRVSFEVETSRALAAPLRRVETLVKFGQRFGLRSTGTQSTTDQPTFFAQLTDALLGKAPSAPVQRTVAASADAAVVNAAGTDTFASGHTSASKGPAAAVPSALPLDNLALGLTVNNPRSYAVRASGDLHQVFGQHPFGRAVLQHPLGRALLPPPGAPDDPFGGGASDYRLQATVAYDAGTYRVQAEAMPGTGGRPAWEAFATLAPTGGRTWWQWLSRQSKPTQLVQGLALLHKPALLPAAIALGCQPPAGDMSAAPLAALMHGFDDMAVLQEEAPTPTPAPTPAPEPRRPAAVAEGLPKSVEEPLLQLLSNVRARAQVGIKAGAYSTGACLPHSQLVIPEDGTFEIDVETQPPDAAQRVYLQRASVRWTGAEPIVWHLGFTQFLFGAAIGRFLDRILHVRASGLRVDADGNAQLDGHVYLLGMRICRVDFLTDCIARVSPGTLIRAETDLSQWLRGVFTQPVVAATNDDLWRMWDDLSAMDLDIQWQLAPREGEWLRADLGQGNSVATAALSGTVVLAAEGDLTLHVQNDGPQRGFAIEAHGALPVQGMFSGRLTSHLFPAPYGVALGTVPDQSWMRMAADVELTGATAAALHAEGQWAGATPDMFCATLCGHADTATGRAAGELALRVGVVPMVTAPADGAATATAPEMMPVLQRAAWTLKDELTISNFSMQAGQGMFLARLTAAQRKRVLAMRETLAQAIA